MNSQHPNKIQRWLFHLPTLDPTIQLDPSGWSELVLPQLVGLWDTLFTLPQGILHPRHLRWSKLIFKKIVENKMGCPKAPSERNMAACWWRPSSQIRKDQPLETSNHRKAVWKRWLKTKIFGIPDSVSSNWLWGPIFWGKTTRWTSCRWSSMSCNVLDSHWMKRDSKDWRLSTTAGVSGFQPSDWKM